ncbi:transposase [Solemya pervernicosa gill symbiont]|uniref:Transposase n=2 Tax=Gammaproteobacteria incertae sedis TaxID=118884 RepID=A0A1T2L2E9_9GAMM|nr:transposase [Candidatus Reidiella endopervernicosa]OOZ39288.1 transposase [Solemya pervernicosa gill symbiont]QKQ28140.1 transposase [Candidatus Reidiella endopervernicosa]
MVLYRRNRVDGGSYFFTATLRDRSSELLVRHVDLLRDAFSTTLLKRPFTIDAMVILPDHLHTIWTLPEGESDYPGRWKAIKARFTRTLRQQSRFQSSPWQSRYWEHTIRDNDDWQRHFDYIHYNPVKHGYVTSPLDWPYSSFAKAVRDGLYHEDWGREIPSSIQRMSIE